MYVLKQWIFLQIVCIRKTVSMSITSVYLPSEWENMFRRETERGVEKEMEGEREKGGTQKFEGWLNHERKSILFYHLSFVILSSVHMVVIIFNMIQKLNDEFFTDSQ